MKICTVCKVEKDDSCFHADKQKTSGYRPDCKLCVVARFHKRRKEKYEEVHKWETRYRLKNRDKINAYKKQDAIDNPEKVKRWSRNSYNRLKDTPEFKERTKKTMERTKVQRMKYAKDKYHSNLSYKLALNLRRRMYKLVKRNQKGGSAVRDLGCSTEEFILYIASKFSPGMSWDNYGEWHLDHIYPLSRVDLTNREEFLKVSHFTNYQPLWAKDNVTKGNKLPDEIPND